MNVNPVVNHLRNPVLPGFHPDPSILRVGEEYFLATSTFEWFPGVRIHRSRDLAHWRHAAYALTRPAQLDLTGNPRSGGVWAPCLSHADGLFHLVYSDVKTWGRGFLDCHNYLVVSPRIEGPWSDPIPLNKSGFDPSLFHDSDGRKWLCNMLWDHRGRDREAFAGIALQEYDPIRRRLVGERQVIFKGSPLGFTEGPHLYRRGPFYYLLVAEGGTSWDHAVTVARARTLEGPFEPDPHTPLLTARGNPTSPLQKAGHGSLVEAVDGGWYLAYLCARPVGRDRCCILGRETALAPVAWTADGWLRLADGDRTPARTVRGPAGPVDAGPPPRPRDDFDAPVLGGDYQTLRVPPDPSWLTLTERPGFLRLHGRESLQSLHRQSLVARRIQSLRCRFETALELAPRDPQEAAGLVCFYDDETFYYLFVSADERGRRQVGLLASECGFVKQLATLPLDAAGPRVWLRGRLDRERLELECSADGQVWRRVGPVLDATLLSDERTSRGLGFTGAFVGLAAQDLAGRGCVADFDYLDYADDVPDLGDGAAGSDDRP
ncbi:MAG TPA: glycoside hydrolase family 43 protein [Polyangia bacterium]|nr:glycoside hydrolase family 43 protein [Polyangia bacterium]